VACLGRRFGAGPLVGSTTLAKEFPFWKFINNLFQFLNATIRKNLRKFAVFVSLNPDINTPLIFVNFLFLFRNSGIVNWVRVIMRIVGIRVIPTQRAVYDNLFYKEEIFLRCPLSGSTPYLHRRRTSKR